MHRVVLDRQFDDVACFYSRPSLMCLRLTCFKVHYFPGNTQSGDLIICILVSDHIH